MIWKYFKNLELQKGVKLIGYSDIIVQILGVVVYGMVLFTQSEDFYKSLSDNDFAWNISDIAGVSTSASGLLIHCIELFIAFGLIKGAKTRDDKKCNSWMKLSILLTILESGTLAGHLSIETNKLLLSYSVPSIIYKFGCCSVAKSYVSQVRRRRMTRLIKEEPTTSENDEFNDDDQHNIST